MTVFLWWLFGVLLVFLLSGDLLSFCGCGGNGCFAVWWCFIFGVMVLMPCRMSKILVEKCFMGRCCEESGVEVLIREVLGGSWRSVIEWCWREVFCGMLGRV